LRKRSEYGESAESASAMYRATSSTDQEDKSDADLMGRGSVVELAVSTHTILYYTVLILNPFSVR